MSHIYSAIALMMLLTLQSRCASDAPQFTTGNPAEPASWPHSDDAEDGLASGRLSGDGMMRVDSGNPRGVEIMEKDCEQGYDVLNLDNRSQPQAEIGISVPVDGEKAKGEDAHGFIYYRCRGSSVPDSVSR